MSFEATPASKSQDSARVWGCQDYKEGKILVLNQKQDSADLPLRITFRSCVEKTCDAGSSKATWPLKVGISALSLLLLAGVG